MTRGLLIVLSGPSGVGKDTVLRSFLAQNADCALSVSATTRPPRKGETGGKDYIFLTRESFGEMAANGDMLEYAEYSGNYYGTPKAPVEACRDAGKNVILEIEVQGALKIREMGLEAVLVFLMPPSWTELHSRLALRGTDSPEKIAQRLDIAKKEIQLASSYDYIIVNDSLGACVEDMKAVIAAAKCRAEYRKEFIKEVLEDAKAVDVSDNRQA